MKTNFLIISMLLVCGIYSCKKKEQDAPYSHWVVNSMDSFSTNNLSKNADGLRSLYAFGGGNDLANTFYMDFGPYGGFPESGNYPITFDNYPFKIIFYYRNVSYLPSQHAFTNLTVVKKNAQVHYLLPPTWFYQWQNHDDSVLINGEFIMP